MDARQLRDEAEKLRRTAESRHKEAERFNVNADSHASDGDDVRAGVDAKQAERMEAEAADMEQQAEQLDVTLAAVTARVHHLTQEKQDLEADYKSRMSAIDKELQRLTGGATMML